MGRRWEEDGKKMGRDGKKMDAFCKGSLSNDALGTMLSINWPLAGCRTMDNVGTPESSWENINRG